MSGVMHQPIGHRLTARRRGCSSRRTGSSTYGWRVYDLPTLATRLMMRGPSVKPVLATLALPASTVAIDTARSMRPAALEADERGGETATMGFACKMSVPSTWTITDAWSSCGWPLPGPPRVFVVKPNLPATACAALAPLPVAQNALVDGALQYWPGAEPTGSAWTATAGQQRLLTLRPSTSVVSVRHAASQPGVLNVRITGVWAAPSLVSVALGRDERVAGRILASIAPNPDE